MFLASHICCVSSGTLSARYCWLPREVSGVKPTMKKCSLGNGIKLTASFRRSARFKSHRHRLRMCIDNAGACDALSDLQSLYQGMTVISPHLSSAGQGTAGSR